MPRHAPASAVSHRAIKATRRKLRLAAVLATAALGAIAAAAPLATGAAPTCSPVAACDTVPVTFNIVHIRTGAPLGGWTVEAIYLGATDPVWLGRTGNNGTVTFDLIEGPYEVRVYRDHPVWITYIEVEGASDDNAPAMAFTIAVNPELG